MNDYKIELVQTETYVFDAKAKTEGEAIKIALKAFQEAEANGTEHYHGTGDGGLEVGRVYNVTGTDDAPTE